MYLVSVYFDKTAVHILQRYINKIAEKTGNSFMVDNNVPPHMTISAIEARSENALLGAMDNLRNSLSNGTISCHMYFMPRRCLTDICRIYRKKYLMR